ncbi:MAG: amidohydrolase family protein [Henriciella sp.]|jgi:predicted TIM-barrel fold metal-dependent hydrolase|nr:amidohydrolase family protein [Henriciella sp.]
MSGPAYIVDAHHHLWDLDKCRHTWLAEKGVVRFFGDPAPIQKNYHVPDLKSDFGTLPVRKSVHIQVGVQVDDSVNETAWLQSQAEAHGLPNAIIPFCDLTEPDVEARLAQHLAHSAVRGVRQIIGRSAEEDRKTGTSNLLSDSAFEHGLNVLAARGLSFDLQLTPPLMNACADLFSKVPDLNVALCHAGSLSAFDEASLEEWESGLRALAELPNLICKVSGFGMFNHNWARETIESHIHKVIEIFGPSRVAFGSNFPVDKLYASYEDTFGAYLSICERYDPSERDAMFRTVAEDFYQI